MPSWPGLPKKSPSAPAGLIAFEANRPVANAPTVPPTPWTPNASSESSYPSIFFNMTTAIKQTIPTLIPINIAEIGPTNPAAGVIATSPATAPLAAPSIVGFPCRIHSTNVHVIEAAAAAICVTTNALVASPPAERALPALNPNHPNQSRAAPMTTSVILCGGIGSLLYPILFPITRAAANAEIPELICTTVPPAKSRAPMFLIHPPPPHTQWGVFAALSALVESSPRDRRSVNGPPSSPILPGPNESEFPITTH